MREHALVGKYRIVAPWTIGCAATIAAAHLLTDRVDLARSLLDAGGSLAICGALFGVANLAVISMLIALAALIGLEDRPVVRMLREAGRYPELIERVVGCVDAGIALGTLAIGTLVVAHLVSAPSPQLSQLASIAPSAHPPGTPLLWALATTALSLGMGVLAQVASVAWLVAAMMSFQPRSPSPSDSPEAARARLRGESSGEAGGPDGQHGQ